MEASWSDVHVCCVYSFKNYDSVSNPDNSRLPLDRDYGDMMTGASTISWHDKLTTLGST